MRRKCGNQHLHCSLYIYLFQRDFTRPLSTFKSTTMNNKSLLVSNLQRSVEPLRSETRISIPKGRSFIKPRLLRDQHPTLLGSEGTTPAPGGGRQNVIRSSSSRYLRSRCFSKLPTPIADRRFAAESPSSRDRVARRLRPAGLRPASRRLIRSFRIRKERCRSVNWKSPNWLHQRELPNWQH